MKEERDGPDRIHTAGRGFAGSNNHYPRQTASTSAFTGRVEARFRSALRNESPGTLRRLLASSPVTARPRSAFFDHVELNHIVVRVTEGYRIVTGNEFRMVLGREQRFEPCILHD